jgi:hypothetical protein
VQRVLAALIAAVLAFGTVEARAQTSGAKTGGAKAVVEASAEALGGKAKLQALKSLTIIGWGHQAYFFGGSNISPDRDAPLSQQNVADFERTFDLQGHRVRTRQRVSQDFIFSNVAPLFGTVRSNQVSDGEIAYDVAPDGKARQLAPNVAYDRRMEMFANPVTAVLAALDPAARLSRLHREGKLEVLDVQLGRSQFTLAVDAGTHLPTWVKWVGPQGNLGDLTYRAAFTGYTPNDGLVLPRGYRTFVDWRGGTASELTVDSYRIDAPFEPMAAPANLGPPPGPPQLTVIKVADGVWFIGGSSVFEFEDHLTLFEAYGSEERFQATLALVNKLVPGKKATQLIVSHHHFDHTGGFRAAVAAGLTIISRRANEPILRELATRPAKKFPDALGRNPKPMRFIAVDDHMTLKDSRMQVELYHVIKHNHMAEALMAYVPRYKLLAEGDMTTQAWELAWHANAYLDNLAYRHIEVAQELPVHGTVTPFAEVMSNIYTEVRKTREICARDAAAEVFVKGCPLQFNYPVP